MKIIYNECFVKQLYKMFDYFVKKNFIYFKAKYKLMLNQRIYWIKDNKYLN